ncbi:IPT/TIG domain-containing protein [Desertivirga arenae]|uniref:IPT/TIG domain-containing protein n=1 Tax=Desertivirga arenae TaxID=2810309 RepID=UPI001A968038|nr:IPT/TIG domain-containing protein [Pedobacter sp. SYSU D00823]
MNLLKYIRINCTAAIAGACILFTSCEKDSNGMNESGPGELNIQEVGPGEGSGGDVLIVKGSGLGAIESVVFEKDSVPAGFNPVFNNENAIVFRVPDTASGGPQNIIFTNKAGKVVRVPFKVIALPTVSEVSAKDVEAGSRVTLTGINLEDVSKVLIDGTTDEAVVVSKSKKELVIDMPASTQSRAKLLITNSSGTKATEQEVVYISNAYQIFTEGQPANVDYWGWSINYATANTFSVSGSNSLKATYTGSWGGFQLHMKNPVDLAQYKYVTFWVKGAEVDKVISFNFNWANTQALNIPANKWTYFKFDLDLFKGSGVSKLDDFIMQVNGDPATFYLDNILLVK